MALWYAHTHASEQFYVTPRLILDSAEPGSGKTRVLEVAQHLVRTPEMTISATPAALFRLVSMGPITILFDEVDAIFNPKNGGNNEDLRGPLNAGYKRSATIAHCVGDAKTMKVERFPVTLLPRSPGSLVLCRPPSPPVPSPFTCAAAAPTNPSNLSENATQLAKPTPLSAARHVD